MVGSCRALRLLLRLVLRLEERGVELRPEQELEMGTGVAADSRPDTILLEFLHGEYIQLLGDG